MSPEIAQRLLAALEDLTLNTNEAMKTGGWVPTPLHASFWEAMAEAMEAVHQAKAAPKVAQPQPHTLTDEQIDAAVDAWFDFTAETSCDYRSRMRRALAVLGIGQEGGAA